MSSAATACAAPTLAAPLSITGCSLHRDGSYQLDLGNDERDCYANLRVELNDNAPYLSVWGVKVESVDACAGEPLSVAETSAWIAAHQREVDDAVLEALEYARITGLFAW